MNHHDQPNHEASIARKAAPVLFSTKRKQMRNKNVNVPSLTSSQWALNPLLPIDVGLAEKYTVIPAVLNE